MSAVGAALADLRRSAGLAELIPDGETESYLRAAAKAVIEKNMSNG